MGERGPLPKSKKELEATGSARAKNRADLERPQSGKGIQEPPDYLTDSERAHWVRLLPKALEMKTYQNADHDSFAQLCRCLNTLLKVQAQLEKDGYLVKVSYGTADGNKTTYRESPLFSTEKRCILNYNQFASQFGFSPLARTRLQITPYKKGAGDSKGPTTPGPQDDGNPKLAKIHKMMNIKKTG